MANPAKSTQAKSRAQKNREASVFMVKERLKFLAPIVIAGLVIGTMVFLRSVDLSSERAKVQGTIVSSTWDQKVVRLQKVIVSVHLDDGRDVAATGHFEGPPEKGKHVVVSERVSPFGTVTYVMPDPI